MILIGDETMTQLTAEVLVREDACITFAVDEVIAASAPLKMHTVEESLAKKLQRPLLTCSDPRLMVVDAYSGCIHPLVSAILTAFGGHRPLCLRPDDIWLTIEQGFSQHVNEHAEVLRERFVRHARKKTLKVLMGSLRQRSDWEVLIAQWLAKVREQLIDPEVHDALLCDFSTTTPTMRIASQIVLMEAFQQYFAYTYTSICGIPSVTLFGTVADWQSIRARVATLACYDLDWWVERLLPICDALIASSRGEPPLPFWQAIVAPKKVYGGPEVKGWLASCFLTLAASVIRYLRCRSPMSNGRKASIRFLSRSGSR